MAKKKASKSTEGAATAAPSATSPEELKEKAPVQKSTLADAAAMGLPMPPAEAFAGIPGMPDMPVLIRQDGRLVPAPGVSTQPPGYPPGKPLSAPRADFSGFPTATPRAYVSTFHAPPPEVAEARGRAESLRAILGQCLNLIEHSIHEGTATLEWLKANPKAADVFAAEGIDVDTVERFIDEAEDVLNTFVPPQPPTPPQG